MSRRRLTIGGPLEGASDTPRGSACAVSDGRPTASADRKVNPRWRERRTGHRSRRPSTPSASDERGDNPDCESPEYRSPRDRDGSLITSTHAVWDNLRGFLAISERWLSA